MKKKDRENLENAEVNEEVNEEVIPEEAAAEAPAADPELESLKKRVEELEKENASLKDSFLRTQADFQNFKRRNATSYTDGVTKGVCDAVEALLPMLDNLERAVAAAAEDSPLLQGVKMTMAQFEGGLKPFGFEEVPAMGQEFDPDLHNAVMREASETPGMILDVFQKGYRVKDKIIRYAMVKVGVEE